MSLFLQHSMAPMHKACVALLSLGFMLSAPPAALASSISGNCVTVYWNCMFQHMDDGGAQGICEGALEQCEASTAPGIAPIDVGCPPVVDNGGTVTGGCGCVNGTCGGGNTVIHMVPLVPLVIPTGGGGRPEQGGGGGGK